MLKNTVTVLTILLVSLTAVSCRSQTPAPESDISSPASSTASLIFSEIPDRTALELLYQNAITSYEMFESVPLAYSETNSVSSGGTQYYQVTDNNFKTYEAFENHIKSIFAPDISKKLFDTGMYVNIDGRLYTTKTAKEKNNKKGSETYSYMKMSDTKVILKVKAENLKDDLKTVSDYTTYDFVYEKTDGTWSFAEFPYFR